MNANQAVVMVQASSTSWCGGVDICMGMVEGELAVTRTLKRALDGFPELNVILIAPEFDRGGKLDQVVAEINIARLTVQYSHDDSPLDRMLQAQGNFGDNDYLVRVDGIHFCFDCETSRSMLQLALEKHVDCVKLPDDFPVHFTSEIYRFGALKKLKNELLNPNDGKFKIHPKCYFVMHKDKFNVHVNSETPFYSDELLKLSRKQAEFIYQIPRQEVNDKRIASGDRLGFHYELALRHIKPTMKTLDVACADGYGVRMLSQKINQVCGADIDEQSIKQARELDKTHSNNYFVEDVTQMSFDENSFDAITSFETLEHVSDTDCLREFQRVLKPGGMLVLSTPQNSMGHIPVNSCHLVEYSLFGLSQLVNQYFIVTKVYGIKAGIIYDDADPFGTNTVMIAINPTKNNR